MAHYAYLDDNNTVTYVIVGKDEHEDGIDWEKYYGAVRCSYNTRGGLHAGGGTPFRYNYPAAGWIFSDSPQWSSQDGAFIPPQPYPSWTLNASTALWDPPTPEPNDGGTWVWAEGQGAWVPVDGALWPAVTD